MANVNGLGWYIMRVAFQVTGLSSEKASHFGPPSAVWQPLMHWQLERRLCKETETETETEPEAVFQTQLCSYDG